MGFQIHLPANIYWGDILDFPNEFLGYGSKAFVVTGKSSAKNGSLADVLGVLEKHKINYNVFNKVEENPPLESVVAAAHEGIEFDPDFIIAIGGGSSIDTAKAASVLINNKTTDTTILFNSSKDRKATPLLSVPTTAGSGSEVTASAILTVHSKKTKTSVSPRVKCEKTFINPRYSYNLSDDITICTAIDVLTHLLEGYTSQKANPITDRLAEGGFIGFSHVLPAIKSRIFDPLFREQIMALSITAGALISNTRTTIPHIMSYPLTYDKGIRHGFSCGILTYEYLVFHKSKDKILRMLSLCGFNDMETLREFFIAECPVIKCDEKRILEYVDIVYSDKDRLKQYPYDIGYEDIAEIYRKSFNPK